jgi:hypothetical protein
VGRTVGQGRCVSGVQMLGVVRARSLLAGCTRLCGTITWCDCERTIHVGRRVSACFIVPKYTTLDHSQLRACPSSARNAIVRCGLCQMSLRRASCERHARRAVSEAGQDS